MATTTASENSVQTNIPVGSIFLRSFIFLIFVFLLGGILDQFLSDGQMFTNPLIMLNIVVRSVALGIVAVGQTLVLIGASIDLSVAYMISITAVMCSYIMQGNTSNVPQAIVVVLLHWYCHRADQRADHHQAAG